MTTFVVGQRVRVARYNLTHNPAWGDPHFIIGHFGHVESFDREWIDVRISHGPGGGPVDQRVFDHDDDNGALGIWPMIADEIEPVD